VDFRTPRRRRARSRRALTTTNGPAHAIATATTCGIAKQKSAAKYAAALLGCYAKAMKAGEPVESECLFKAGSKFNIVDIEDKDACIAPGLAGTLSAMVNNFVAGIVLATPPGSFAKCAAAKQKARRARSRAPQLR
jgi:hypothetical protein